MYINKYIYIYIYIYKYICICTYIHIYIHTHAYAYIYIRTHTHAHIQFAVKNTFALWHNHMYDSNQMVESQCEVQPGLMGIEAQPFSSDLYKGK